MSAEPLCSKCNDLAAEVQIAMRREVEAGRGRALARAQRLEGALREALEFADEGWSYASVYFRAKWDYEGERAKLHAALAAEEDG